MGLGDDIYSGSASFGRIMSIIKAVIGTLVGIAMIIGGIFLVRSRTKYSESTTAKILNTDTDKVDCVRTGDQTGNSNDNDMWNCSNIKLSWTVGGKNYDNKNSPMSYTGSTNLEGYKNGASVNIYYDPSNPRDITIQRLPTHIFGWILLGLGILILISGWLWVLITQKSNFAAATSGVATTAGLISDAIR